MLSLCSPSSHFLDSYRTFVAEFLASGERLTPFTLAIPIDNFEAYLAELERYGRGEGMEAGFVAHSTYWLIENEAEVVAVSNIRHGLTDRLRHEGGSIGYGVRPSRRGEGLGIQILEHTLAQARILNLKDVLLTCSSTNLPSIRTILRNGGRLESEEYLPEQARQIQRYWVTL